MPRWREVEAWTARLGDEGEQLVRATLERIEAVPPDDYVPHHWCAETLAAAEVVASCAGAAPDEVPDPIRDHVERCGVPDEALLLSALRAVERVGMQRREHDDALVDLEERLAALVSA